MVGRMGDASPMSPAVATPLIIPTQMLYYETQNNNTYMTSGLKQKFTLFHS